MEFVALGISLSMATLKGIQAFTTMARDLSQARGDVDEFRKNVNFVCEKLEMVRAIRIRLRNELLASESGSIDTCSTSQSASVTSRQLQAVLLTETTAWASMVKIDNRILASIGKRFKEGQLPGHQKTKRGKRDVFKMSLAWSLYLKKEAEAVAPGLEKVGLALEKRLERDIQMSSSAGLGMGKALGREEPSRLAMVGVEAALEEAAAMLGDACKDDDDDGNTNAAKGDDDDTGVDAEIFEVFGV